jgi:hypothetical protein
VNSEPKTREIPSFFSGVVACKKESCDCHRIGTNYHLSIVSRLDGNPVALIPLGHALLPESASEDEREAHYQKEILATRLMAYSGDSLKALLCLLSHEKDIELKSEAARKDWETMRNLVTSFGGRFLIQWLP